MSTPTLSVGIPTLEKIVLVSPQTLFPMTALLLHLLW
jgi:hypothetical protein